MPVYVEEDQDPEISELQLMGNQSLIRSCIIEKPLRLKETPRSPPGMIMIINCWSRSSIIEAKKIADGSHTVPTPTCTDGDKSASARREELPFHFQIKEAKNQTRKPKTTTTTNTHLRRTPKTHILRIPILILILKRRRKIELFALVRRASGPLDPKAGVPEEVRRVDHPQRVLAFLRERKDAGQVRDHLVEEGIVGVRCVL
jgi:hypothetical protein